MPSYVPKQIIHKVQRYIFIHWTYKDDITGLVLDEANRQKLLYEQNFEQWVFICNKRPSLCYVSSSNQVGLKLDNFIYLDIYIYVK